MDDSIFKWLFGAVAIGLISFAGYSAVEELADSRKPADVLIYEKCMDKANFGNPTEKFRKSSTENCAVLLASYTKQTLENKGGK